MDIASIPFDGKSIKWIMDRYNLSREEALSVLKKHNARAQHSLRPNENIAVFKPKSS